MDRPPLTGHPEAALRLADLIAFGDWVRSLLGDAERRLMTQIAAVAEEHEEQTAAHAAEHVRLLADAATTHRRYDEWIAADELARKYRAGQVSALRWIGGNLVRHYRPIAWLLTAIAVLLGLANGAIRVEFGP